MNAKSQKLDYREVKKWIAQKSLGYNRAYRAAVAFVELSEHAERLELQLEAELKWRRDNAND
jgi:hypothetical protein